MKLCVLFALLVFRLNAIAASGNEKIVAVTEELAPYSYTENKKLTGFSVEVAEYILRRAGYDFQMNSYPWARSYMLAKTNPNVMIFTMARTAERENDFHWIGSLGARRLYLFKLAARKEIQIKNLDDAKRYKIGVDRNDASEQFLKDRGFEIDKNLDRSPDEIANVNKLLIGRIDFIAGSDLTVLNLVRRLGLQVTQIERSILLVDQGEYFIAMSKTTSQNVVDRLKIAYLEVQKSGLLSELRSKFGMPIE